MTDAQYDREVAKARTMFRAGKVTINDFRHMMRNAKQDAYNRRKPYVLRLYVQERRDPYAWFQTADEKKARDEGRSMMRETRRPYLPGGGRRVIAYDVIDARTGQLVTPEPLATAAD